MGKGKQAAKERRCAALMRLEDLYGYYGAIAGRTSLDMLINKACDEIEAGRRKRAKKET
jgi:hypothetical protein